MNKAGAEVVFAASSFVRQGNGSVYPLREESGLFLWDTLFCRQRRVLCSLHIGTVALPDGS